MSKSFELDHPKWVPSVWAKHDPDRELMVGVGFFCDAFDSYVAALWRWVSRDSEWVTQ